MNEGSFRKSYSQFLNGAIINRARKIIAVQRKTRNIPHKLDYVFTDLNEIDAILLKMIIILAHLFTVKTEIEASIIFNSSVMTTDI